MGTRAVYLAGSDDTASREVLARKKRLGNDAQISLAKYPRIVFAVAVSLHRVVTWFAKTPIEHFEANPRSMSFAKTTSRARKSLAMC
jgi:hypothetical protein